MIAGVQLKNLKVIPDERGRLMEILRSDDKLFQKFGQVYMTSLYPGVVKGWHYHKKQVDNFACVHGMVKAVLYDDRKKSNTYGEVNEFFMGLHNAILLQVPALVWHGFKCIGDHEAILVNVPTEKYIYATPDEYRAAPHGKKIPYDWSHRDG